MMRHLIRFNESQEYYMIDWGDVYKMTDSGKGIDLCQSDVTQLTDYCNSNGYKYNPVRINQSHHGYKGGDSIRYFEIESPSTGLKTQIWRYDDDWFVVYDEKLGVWKCDQMYGLKKFLNDEVFA